MYDFVPEYLNPWHFKLVMIHHAIMTWQHFPLYWGFVREIHLSPMDSPQKGPVRLSFDFCVCLPEQPVEQLVQMLVIWDD